MIYHDIVRNFYESICHVQINDIYNIENIIKIVTNEIDINIICLPYTQLKPPSQKNNTNQNNSLKIINSQNIIKTKKKNKTDVVIIEKNNTNEIVLQYNNNSNNNRKRNPLECQTYISKSLSYTDSVPIWQKPITQCNLKSTLNFSLQHIALLYTSSPMFLIYIQLQFSQSDHKMFSVTI